MNKFFNYFKKSKKYTEEELESAVQKAVKDFHNEIYATHYNKPQSYDPESTDMVNSEFTKFFGTNKISTQADKELFFAAFDYPPENNIEATLLNAYQDALWTKYRTDPLATGIVETFVDYVIGSGLKTYTPVQEVTDALLRFRKNNKLVLKEKEIVRHSFIDGEYYVLFFINPKTGDVYIRKAHPKTITNVEPNPGDVETIYSFRQEFALLDSEGNTGIQKYRYIKSADYDDVLNLGIFTERSKYVNQFEPNMVCLQIKLNDSDQLRGYPPLKVILKSLKLYENFLMDRMILNHERSKVVWIKKIIGRAIDTFKAKASPRGGTMLVESDGITYRTEKPNLDSSEAKEDALNLLYYIGTPIRYPLHILNQRTDQQVYASIKKADTPFAKMIHGSQTLFGYYFEHIHRIALKELVKAGKLKKQYEYAAYTEDAVISAMDVVREQTAMGKTYEEVLNAATDEMKKGETKVKVNTEDIPISFDFPQLTLDDPKAEAEVLKIHKEIGIASSATLSAKAGYDWVKEYARIMRYDMVQQDEEESDIKKDDQEKSNNKNNQNKNPQKTSVKKK